MWLLEELVDHEYLMFNWNLVQYEFAWVVLWVELWCLTRRYKWTLIVADPYIGHWPSYRPLTYIQVSNFFVNIPISQQSILQPPILLSMADPYLCVYQFVDLLINQISHHQSDLWPGFEFQPLHLLLPKYPPSIFISNITHRGSSSHTLFDPYFDRHIRKGWQKISIQCHQIMSPLGVASYRPNKTATTT